MLTFSMACCQAHSDNANMLLCNVHHLSFSLLAAGRSLLICSENKNLDWYNNNNKWINNTKVFYKTNVGSGFWNGLSMTSVFLNSWLWSCLDPVISLEGKSRVHQNYHIVRAVCLDNNLHSDLWNSWRDISPETKNVSLVVEEESGDHWSQSHRSSGSCVYPSKVSPQSIP